MVGALLQLPPERHVGIETVLGEIFRGHAERIGLHLDCVLPAAEGLAGDRVDLADLVVGHREAAGRRAGAVDHDRAAGMAERAVEALG